MEGALALPLLSHPLRVCCPHPHCPEMILRTGAPSQSPPRASLPPQGWQAPGRGAPGRCSPKSQNPSGLPHPHPRQPSPALRGKEGRKEGLAALPG